jgi:hypothetical protein
MKNGRIIAPIADRARRASQVTVAKNVDVERHLRPRIDDRAQAVNNAMGERPQHSDTLAVS